MVRWDSEIKNRARELAKDNLSLTEISRLLKVPKITAHSWFTNRDRPRITDRLEHLKSIRLLAAFALNKKRESRLEKVETRVIQEVKEYPQGKLCRYMFYQVL